MQIDSSLVMKLREATGLGMMLCKKALIEAEGNMEKAIENLRKQGQATAAKRADKTANEGKIAIIIKNETALIYEVNCETDFVTRNVDFTTLVDTLGAILIEHKPATLEDALKLTPTVFKGQTIDSRILEIVAKIGEKISLRRFRLLTIDTSKQHYAHYIHGNGRIGILAVMTTSNPAALGTPALIELGKDCAMQVAASKPIAVDRTVVAQSILDKEMEIYRAQAQTSGKPEKIWDKIIEGKLQKFFKDVTLLEQEFIRDTEMSVSDRIKKTEKELNTTITVNSFIRYELGSEE